MSDAQGLRGEDVPKRGDFRHFLAIPTRWMDNDHYGHVNNVVYYSFFDTLVSEFLVSHGGLDPATSGVIGFAVETHCQFLRPLSFPQVIDAGLRVGHLGRTSTRYEIALFAQGEEAAAATGYFVHVFVDRHTHRPQPIPATFRTALAAIQVPNRPAKISNDR